MNLKRLAIITTHPIQYNAPLFKLLQERSNIIIRIFYTWGKEVLENKFDPDFGKTISWDIPLLDGYDYSFEKNISANPGSHHFKGIDNPDLIGNITAWNADAVLVYGWCFKSHLKCLRYFHKRIPVYFRGDSTLLDEKFGIKKILRTIYLKWVYQFVDRAFYVGTQNKLYYLKHGITEDQLLLASHSIDNNFFSDLDGTHSNKALHWRRQLNIGDDHLVFLFAGKLEPKKNPELLIRSFISIQQPGIHLILIGNGILENELKEKYAKIVNLHFIDFQNQTMMPVVYRLGDVFVLPSSGPGETWGLSVNEAMACNRPVIVSDKAGCAVDLVEEGKNGYIFKVGDVGDLAKKMCLIFENKRNQESMGKESLEIIKKYNLNFIAAAIEMEVNKK